MCCAGSPLSAAAPPPRRTDSRLLLQRASVVRAGLPQRMRFIDMIGPGGPEVLTVSGRPLPRPAAQEVLIRVAAAGVNRPDVLQRAGSYPPPGASPILGFEVSGMIAALGDGVADWPVGEEVGALVAGLDLVHLMVRRQTITGSTLRPPSVADKAAITGVLRNKVWPLIEAGRVRPSAAAHRPDISAGRSRGGARIDGVGPAYRQDSADDRLRPKSPLFPPKR